MCVFHQQTVKLASPHGSSWSWSSSPRQAAPFSTCGISTWPRGPSPWVGPARDQRGHSCCERLGSYMQHPPNDEITCSNCSAKKNLCLCFSSHRRHPREGRSVLKVLSATPLPAAPEDKGLHLQPAERQPAPPHHPQAVQPGDAPPCWGGGHHSDPLGRCVVLNHLLMKDGCARADTQSQSHTGTHTQTHERKHTHTLNDKQILILYEVFDGELSF